MKTKQVVLAGFLLAGIFGASAQTITLNSTTPTSSTTIGGGSSLRLGTGAGNATTTGANNAFIGNNAGTNNTSGSDNAFAGWGAGANNTIGSYNAFFGRSAGDANTTATYNTFLGSLSGVLNTVGACNTFVGFGAGGKNVGGGNNVLTGFGTGGTLNAWGNSMYGTQAGGESVGDGNTLLGYRAGLKAGSSNVMIGATAGANAVNVNSQLFIDNTDTASPLVWGDFANDQLKLNAKVGIGAAFGTFPTTAGAANVSTYNLFVKGGILTDEVRVALNTTWADYVFANDYNLKPLAEVEAFIAKNKHLPNVPSAKQVKEEGIELADMARIQQEKIEELTLYIIAQNKRIEALEAKMNTK